MKTIAKSLAITTLAALTLSTAANATQISKKLHFGELHLKGQNTIKLKEELKMQHPGFNLQNKKIVGIDVIAKSKRGTGTATLKVDGMTSYSKTIDGYPAIFHARGGMDLVSLRNPAYSSQGAWQAKLEGNIKLRAIIVKMKNKRVHPRPTRIAASCDINTGGNFFKPKTKVNCTITGKGAVSYKVKVDGSTKWRGNLRPGLRVQSFETTKKKLVLNWQPNIKVIVMTRNGVEHRVY